VQRSTPGGLRVFIIGGGGSSGGSGREAMVGTPMVGAATGVTAGVMATAGEEEDAEEANGGVLV